MTPFVMHESAGAPARKTRQGYSSPPRTSGSSASDARPCHGTNPNVTIVMMIPFSGMPRMPTRPSRVPRSEKALVRAVARVGEGSPAKCGSAQESEADRVYAPSEAQARDRGSDSASRTPAVWTRATLADENTWRQCFFCPHCQHLWDISRTPTIPAMTLSQRIVRRRARPGVALA
jgi:hypothetical protein